MLNITLFLGLALALDSFAVSAAIGAAGFRRSRHLWLALGFGICDGLASLLGALLGLGTGDSLGQWLSWPGPLAVAGYALYVALLAGVTRSARITPVAAWPVFGLPFCLSLDNFLTGGRLNTLELPAPVTAMLFGMCSGLLAFGGLRLGGWAAARWPSQARRAGVLGLLVLAVVLGGSGQ